MALMQKTPAGMTAHKPQPSTLTSMQFAVSAGKDTLELFIERLPASKSGAGYSSGIIDLTAPGGLVIQKAMDPQRFREHMTFRLAEGDKSAGAGACALALHGVRVALAYVYGPDVLDTGVNVVIPSASHTYPDMNGTILNPRGAVHFQPPAGHWMNDPNGLTRFRGSYHMFFQFNPYGWEWDNMHWGHAISPDLVHWRMLPVFLFPQRELECDPNLTGGAFSGSAITIGKDGRPCPGDKADAIKVYFTRRRGIKNRNMAFSESQCTATCHDGLHVDKGSEKKIVSRPSDTFGLDFRDPNVRVNLVAYQPTDVKTPTGADPAAGVAPTDGTVYATMAVATSMPKSVVEKAAQQDADRLDPVPNPVPGIAGQDLGGWYADAPSSPKNTKNPAPQRAGAMAIFENRTPTLEDDKWTFARIYLTDTGNPAASFECPDHFRLDGSDAAVAALMNHRDAVGVYRPVRWYAGRSIGGRLQVHDSGWCDNGPCYYAVQSFTDDTGRRIAFGWEQDELAVRRQRPGASNGDMSLPRELHVHEGRLFGEPVREVYENLLGNQLGTFDIGGFAGRGGLRVSQPIPVKGNAYYIDLRFNAAANQDETARADFQRPQNFQLLLGSYGREKATLECSQRNVYIALDGVPVFGTRFVAPVVDLHRVEVFYDRGLVECFVNSGEQAITVLIDDSRQNGACGALSVMYPFVVTRGTIRALRL